MFNTPHLLLALTLPILALVPVGCDQLASPAQAGQVVAKAESLLRQGRTAAAQLALDHVATHARGTSASAEAATLRHQLALLVEARPATTPLTVPSLPASRPSNQHTAATISHPDDGIGTLCGGAAALPSAVSIAGWGRFGCLDREDAGPRWSSCLTRASYTDLAGRGCPGAQLCCPPADVDLNRVQGRIQAGLLARSTAPSREAPYLVLAGALSQARSKGWDTAQDVTRRLRAAGFAGAKVVDSSRFPNLRDGFWAVVVAAFSDAGDAHALVRLVKQAGVPDAYSKPAWSID